MNGTTSASPRLRVAAYCRAAADGEEQSLFLEKQRKCYEERSRMAEVIWRSSLVSRPSLGSACDSRRCIRIVS